MKDKIAALLIFGLIWSAGTLLFDFRVFLVPAVQQWRTGDFAAVEGTILSCRVKEDDGEDGTTYGVEVEYAYDIEGRKFHGNRFQYGTFPNPSDSAWATRFVERHQPGTKIPVYYDTQSPQACVLVKGIQGMHLFLAVFMTPFNVVMLGLLYWPAKVAWRRWTKPVAGGVKLISGPRNVRARLVVFGPIAVAVITIGILAFLSIFTITIFQAYSLNKMEAAWGIILAGGIIAGAVRALRIHSGKYDLLIDELHGFVELPLTHGRKIRRRIPFANIGSVYVDIVVKPGDSEGGSTKAYAPTMVVKDTQPVAEKLAQWSDETQAQEFVKWLQAKLPSRQPEQSRATDS